MSIMGLSFVMLAILMQFQYGGFSGSVPYHCDNYRQELVPGGTCAPHLIPVSCNTVYPTAFEGRPECTYCSVFGLHTSFGNKLGHLFVPGPEPQDMNALNSAEDHHSFCAACPADAVEDHTLTETGCIAHTNSWALTYPSFNLAMLMFSIHFLFIGVLASPVGIHRVMVARDDSNLKGMMDKLHFFPVCFFLPPTMLGVIKMAQWNSIPGHPFVVAILQMMEINPLFHMTGALLCTSAVAAFMSTSDSIVLAASNSFTMDYWTNWIAKVVKQEGQLAGLICAKVFSVVFMYSAVYVALYSKMDVLQLINIGWGTLAQCFPAWAAAVLLDLHSKPLIMGVIVGTVVTIYTEFMIEESIVELGGADPYTHSVHWLGSFFWGMIANVVTLTVAEIMCKVLAISNPDAWAFLVDDNHESREGSFDVILDEVKEKWGDEKLTLVLVNEMMQGRASHSSHSSRRSGRRCGTRRSSGWASRCTW